MCNQLAEALWDIWGHVWEMIPFYATTGDTVWINFISKDKTWKREANFKEAKLSNQNK